MFSDLLFLCSDCYSLAQTYREGGLCVDAWPKQAGQRSATQFWGIFFSFYRRDLHRTQKKRKLKITKATANDNAKNKQKIRQSLINPNRFVISDTYSGRQYIHWKQHAPRDATWRVSFCKDEMRRRVCVLRAHVKVSHSYLAHEAITKLVPGIPLLSLGTSH